MELNLEKVIYYINISNEYDPQFKLDPHKCVSVIRLLIRKNSYEQSIELIDSLGRYDVVPNYMYRRVRDLLIDGYSLLSFEQFQILIKKLFENNYLDPSSIVLSLIVRKAYHDHGPLYAFEVIKNLMIQYNNLVGMFPIIRKLLRDDCTEELKQVEKEKLMERLMKNCVLGVDQNRKDSFSNLCIRTIGICSDS